MNQQYRNRKRVLASVLAGSLLLGGAFAAQARDKGACDSDACREKMEQRLERFEKKRSENLQRRLEVLQQRLQLTEKQQADWQRFGQALQSGMPTLEKMQKQQDKKAATVPQRMARQEARMQERVKRMSEKRKVVEQFYATLSASQKAAFDVSFFDKSRGGWRGARGGKKHAGCR